MCIFQVNREKPWTCNKSTVLFCAFRLWTFFQKGCIKPLLQRGKIKKAAIINVLWRLRLYMKRMKTLENRQKNNDFNFLSKLKSLCGGGRWIRTTEVTDNRFTVCPLWPLGNSPWSWWSESNQQPADYKSAALPLSHTSIFNLFERLKLPCNVWYYNIVKCVCQYLFLFFL